MIHVGLTVEKWSEFSLMEQLANIGVDVERAIRWRETKKEYSRNAFYRALELIDFTIADQKNRYRLQEICRMREVLVDDFAGDNIYQSTDETWQKYFYSYNWASALGKGRLGVLCIETYYSWRLSF